MNNKEFLKHLYKEHNLVEEDVYIMERKSKGKIKKNAYNKKEWY